MIVYHAGSVIDYPSYGIQIPQKDRGLFLLDRLRQGGLGDRLDQLLDTGPFVNIGRDALLLAHDPAYVDRLLSPGTVEAELVQAFELINPDGSYNRYDPKQAAKPLCGLVDSILARVAATFRACELGMEHGFAYFLGGGMHHAMPGEGRGFCPVNDIVIALRMIREHGARFAWIVDVDAHRGDGTAVICLDDPDILTLSIHTARGWPLDGPLLEASGNLTQSRYPSDVDIPMPVHTEDRYLPALAQGLGMLECLSFGRVPDLVLVVGGSDPYELDGLPSASGLKLSLEQMFERDRYLYQYFRVRNIPQAWVAAGGYGPEVWRVYARFLSWLAERLLP